MFCKSSTRKDGLSCWCRECRTADARRVRANNPTGARNASARFYARHRERRAAEALDWYHTNKNRVLDYRAANAEHFKAYAAAYAGTHRESLNARARAWRAEHLEEARERARRRQHLKRAATRGSDVTLEAWSDLCSLWDHCCAYCGSTEVSLTQDHVVPLTRGGRHIMANLLPACRHCNCSKGARSLSEWRYGQLTPKGVMA